MTTNFIVRQTKINKYRVNIRLYKLERILMQQVDMKSELNFKDFYKKKYIRTFVIE